MIHYSNDVCWDTVIRGRNWSREPTQSVCILSCFPDLYWSTDMPRE